MRPSTMRTLGGSTPSTALPIMLLPAPLSPTSARTSPGSTVSDTERSTRAPLASVALRPRYVEAGAHRSTGSKRAFSPSPNWLKESTVRNSVISGNTSTHHA